MDMFRVLEPGRLELETPQARFSRLTKDPYIRVAPVAEPLFTAFCGICRIFVHVDKGWNWCPFCQQVLGA